VTDKFKERFLKFGSLDRFLIFILITGLVIAGISLFRGITYDSQVQVEFINSNDSKITDSKKIMVDIEGAVISPGVYEMSDQSRIKDVLIMAGGYSAEADRDFTDKQINQAQVVKDGQKIYIPTRTLNDGVGGYLQAQNIQKTVNINTASESVLDTLWGVGKSRVESIVKNRPYESIEELVSKKVFTKTIFDKNKDILVVY